MFDRLRSWAARILRRGQRTAPDRLCEKCGKAAIVFACQVSERRITKEQQFCSQCATQSLWMPNPAMARSSPGENGNGREVSVEVEKLICYSGSTHQYIIFREVQGSRQLTMLTGYFEATALWWFLKGEPNPRPPTHDAWLNTAIALGATLVSACVHDRQGDAYFADIRLDQGGSTVKVDVRPSDALLLTLRAGVPFYFTEKLLAQYAVSEPEPV